VDPVRGAELRDRLIDEVAVKETFFLRHPRELAAIDWLSLWDGAREDGRQRLRVWSAACATGEEPYTLAMLACEAFGSSMPPVSILATDISRSAIAMAQRGEYGPRAVRELTEARTVRWFEPSGQRLVVGPELRPLVTARQHNLTRDVIPPAGEPPFDLIVCRNVLIYFDRPTVHRLLGALECALTRGGSLVIGAADRLSGPLGETAIAPRRSRTRSPVAPSAGAASPPRRAGSAQPTAKVSARPRAQRVDDAVRAMHAASLEDVAQQTGKLLERDPLNVDAYFVRGVAQLASGDPSGAVVSLRRALYLQPEFGLAAFKLARAYEALGDTSSARRAYHRALRSLRPDDPRSAALLEQVDVADIAIACRKRLAELDGAG
jgi:chemotaxis methyl-accepting protein methylase